MDKFFEKFTGRPNNPFTADNCYDADCLHSCYGAPHESYCSICFAASINEEQREKLTDVEYALICDGCTIPPTPWTEPTPMPYEDFRALLIAQQESES